MYISYLGPERKVGQPGYQFWFSQGPAMSPDTCYFIHLSTPQCPHLLNGELSSTSEDQL